MKMISQTLALRLCGALYLFILITNAAGVALGNKADEVDSEAKLLSINENPDKFRYSLIISLVSHVGILLISGLLYVAFSPFNRTMALIGTLFRLGEGFVMINNEFQLFSLFGIAKNYLLQSSDKKGLIEMVDLLLQAKSTGFLVGLFLLAVGALAYGVLFVSNGVIPMRLAWLGLAASVLSIVGILIRLRAPSSSIVYAIGLLSMMIFELSFGGWLLFYSSKAITDF